MNEKREREEEDIEDTKKKKLFFKSLDISNYGKFNTTPEENNEGIKLFKYLEFDHIIQCSNGTLTVNKMIADLVFFKKKGFAEPKYELPFKVLSVGQFFLDFFEREHLDLEEFDLKDYAEANEYLGGDLTCLETQTIRWFSAKGPVASVKELASLSSSHIEKLREYTIRYVIEKRQPSFAWDVYLEMENVEYKDEFVFYLNFSRKLL